MELLGMFIPLGLSAIVIVNLILRYKLRVRELETRGSDPQLGPGADARGDDLSDMRAQLANMQERLDFTERLLTDRSSSQEDTDA